jgi:hypothetical protein
MREEGRGSHQAGDELGWQMRWPILIALAANFLLGVATLASIIIRK